MFRIISVVILFCFISMGLQAQDELHFSHFGTGNGFSIDKANTIVQDSKGFIWIGTWNGLNRFDGYNCVTYQPNFHDSTSISNREITELLVDKNENLWIGTSNGLNCMNLKSGELTRYPFSSRILSLCEDHKGNIWIGTWTGGLFKLDIQTRELFHFLDNDVVSDIYEDPLNRLWVATYNGLVRFSPEHENYTRYLPEKDKNSLSHSIVTQVCGSADSNLWVGTWGGGLNKVDVEKESDEVYFTAYPATENANSLSSGIIYRLFYDAYNNLWIGTWNDGLNLLKYDQQQLPPEKARFLIYKEDPDNQGSLSGNGISSVYVDKGGQLWIGAGKTDCASILDNGIKHYALPVRKDDSSNKISIRCFTQYKNQLWIGTSYNILQYEKDGEVYVLREIYEKQTYRYKSVDYRAYSIFDMFADSTGLWMGTEDAGIIHYQFTPDLKIDRKTRTFFNTATEPSLPDNKVQKLFPSKKYPGVIWIGSMEKGFAKLVRGNDGEVSVIEKYAAKNSANALSDNNTRTIYEDSQGKVWIGTQNGLNCFNPETEHFDKFFYSTYDVNSINDNVVNAILEDSFGNLWVGTNSGLNKKVSMNGDGRNVKFKGYPEIRYLSNEFVSTLMEDKSGHLWLRTYRGFVKFNIAEETVAREYFSKDFENVSLERNAGLKLDDGTFILGTQSDFITFSPDSLFKNSMSYQVEITDLLIFNKSIGEQKGKHEKYGLSTTIPFIDQVKLSHKDKMVTFVFSAMDYKNPDKSAYSYILEGFDSQWNMVNTQNSATYTNIPPGNYTFKVKATSSDGIASKDITTVSVSVSPPWWKTNWAYLIYSLLFIGALYLLHRLSINREKVKNNLVIEKLKSEELQRLNEQKSLFFTDITHELRTPLTLILGPSKELSADSDLKPYAKKQAELIKNSAYKLLRLVNQLMEFRKIEKGILDTLYIRQYNLNNLLHDVFGFFKPMADSRRIDFSIEFEQEPIIAYFDPEKIEKVMFNLVSNAFKYSSDNGKITIRTRQITDSGKSIAVIEVADNGVGIAQEYREKVFERFFQAHQLRTQSTGGIGLFLAKALVVQHGGTIELDSEVGKGSCFRVLLPIDSELVEKVNVESTEARDLPLDDVSAVTPADDGKMVFSKDKLNILVIEDDVDLNSFLCGGLSDTFRVESAFNGKEALVRLEKELPDLILTDIMMPEMDGFEFCRTIRKNINLSHIPVVFLTAKTMQDDEMKGLKLGAVDYIYKPFNLVSLRLKIRNILATQKQIQERIRKEQILQPEHIELSSLDDQFLKDAVEAVNNNLDNPNYDVEAFSADLKVSSNQVYRKIKALTGQTAKEFIRNQRLKVAADLLAQHKRSISEVIYMVGFTSPSYFSRCFKEFYGCTPKEYIEKNCL